MLAQVLEPLLGQTGWLDEVAVAQNSAQAARMWAVREGISLAQRQYGPAIKHDIALPVTAVADFCEQAAKRLRPWLAQEPLGLRWVNFGHLGDGNLHFNLLLPQGAAAATVELLTCQLNPVVHDLVHSMGGSISAEHGIGQLRREENRRYKSSVEMDLMLLIKRALDPNLVMNPGKLF
jgi:FAD/FMN-containing dehydrogenase